MADDDSDDDTRRTTSDYLDPADCVERSIAAAEENDPQDHRPGCYRCSQGWRHGCWDDICRSNQDAHECPAAVVCRCNPEREVPDG